MTKNEKSKKLNIIDSKEPWSEYTIDDGTIIRVKPVVTKIILLEKDGNQSPSYTLSIHPIIDVVKKDE